jgi:hypothetical protein
MSFNLLSNIWFASAIALANRDRVRPALAPASKTPQLEKIETSNFDLFEMVRRIVRRILFRALSETKSISHNFERNCDTCLASFFKASGRLEEVGRLDIARFAGFVRGLTKIPFVWQAIEPQPDRGFNSPHNFGHLLPELWEKFKTPGRAIRQIVLVRKRAGMILAPAGIKPCWEDVLISVLAHSQVGKAAVVLAARTKSRVVRSTWDCFREINTYRTAREFLMWTRGLKPLDEAQNVLAIWQGVESRPTETIEVEEDFEGSEESPWFVTAMPTMARRYGALVATPATGIWAPDWYQSRSFYEDPFPQKGFFIEHPSLGGVFVKSLGDSSAVSTAEAIFAEIAEKISEEKTANQELNSRISA